MGKQALAFKKNSPHIFFAAGVVGAVGSTFLACRATLKLEETLDEVKHDLENVKAMGHASKELGTDYAEQDYYRDLGYVYAKSTIRIGRLYGAAVLLGSASIAALTGSHVQLTRRNAALTATLAMVSKAFDEYRLRVQSEIGTEREYDIYHNLHEEEVEVDGEKQVVKVQDPNGWSIYARFFDEANPNWQKNAEYNRIFLQANQNYFNDRLQAYGHVFLNEVYDRLELERSEAGQIVGWVLNGDGDGYIDFGIFNPDDTRFVNLQERSILLDFNVDGPIIGKLWSPES